MIDEFPCYYSELGPFEATFQTGNPILTYHKLGPRPRRVRIRGLYLSRRAFARQLQELRNAGYISGSLAGCARPWAGKRIVLTFDDGYVNAVRYGLEPLARTNFKAIQFLTADLLGKWNEWDVPLGEAPERMMDVAQVREWLAAGHDIGSHTLTHPFLTRLSLPHAKEEITASRKKLEDLFGRAVEHFCYPFGDWNEPVRELVAADGYKTACTTEAGINTEADSRFALKRFTARYRSWSPKRLWARVCLKTRTKV